MAIDYASVTAGITPFTLDGIAFQSTLDGNSKRWTLRINWPSGEITYGRASCSTAQTLTAKQRVAYTAAREFLASHPTRGDFAVKLRIGRPYVVSDDEWACGIALDGLYSHLGDQHGIDSFQALMLAQNLARTLLAAFVEDGGVLKADEEGTVVDVSALFKSGIASRVGPSPPNAFTPER